MLAAKLIPVLPVGLLAMPARTASAAGVAGVNGNDRHPDGKCLVGHECAELVERPTLHATSLRLASGGPCPYPRQFLNGDGALRVFGLGDDSLRDDVVFVGSESTLLLPDLAEPTTCRLGAALVQTLPTLAVAFANLIDLRAGEGLPVGIDGEVDDAHIDPDHVGRLDGRRRFVFDLDVQEISAVPTLDERGAGGFAPFQCGLLVRPEAGRDLHPSREERQAERPVPLGEREDSLIVVDAGRLEGGVHLGRNLEGRTRASDGTNGTVRRQSELGTDSPICFALNLDLVRGADPPRGAGGEVANLRERHQCGVNVRRLFGCRGEFADDGSHGAHVGDCITAKHHMQCRQCSVSMADW